MSQQQQTPIFVNLFKPTELFDPEGSMVIDLFFEDERVFPSGKYASNGFLMNLGFLQMILFLGLILL
jgi:hypothetical protein